MTELELTVRDSGVATSRRSRIGGIQRVLLNACNFADFNFYRHKDTEGTEKASVICG